MSHGRGKEEGPASLYWDPQHILGFQVQGVAYFTCISRASLIHGQNSIHEVGYYQLSKAANPFSSSKLISYAQSPTLSREPEAVPMFSSCSLTRLETVRGKQSPGSLDSVLWLHPCFNISSSYPRVCSLWAPTSPPEPGLSQ